MPPTRVIPRLESLTSLFYDSIDRLGRFAEVSAEEMPPVYRMLLAHEHHMTVTVEQFHGTPVDVKVLAAETVGQHYARKILLVRQSDGAVVQFGIMRVNFADLGPEIQREIESQKTPLGRILIQHNVHREIHLRSLWRVEPAEELAALFLLPHHEVTYGRTALIECNGEPSIQLLEIVRPEHETQQ